MPGRPRGWLAALLLTLFALGCAESAPPADSAQADSASPAAPRPITVRDDAGRTVTIPHPATRVLSLIPAQTDVVQQLAGARVLVGRTIWDTDPALAHLPSTENALTPSVEWIAALKPDLVLAWPDQSARNVILRLEAIGVPVYASAVESLADVDAMVQRLGLLLGRTARADTLLRTFHAQLDSLRARVAGRPRPSVLYALSFDPPMAASNASYLGELIELAGGSNLFADVSTQWPQVSLEEIVRRAPDVIIRPVEHAGDDALRELRARPGWRELPAVRAGRVHSVDVNLMNRPGLRIPAAAAQLARAIHPEAFE